MAFVTNTAHIEVSRIFIGRRYMRELEKALHVSVPGNWFQGLILKILSNSRQDGPAKLDFSAKLYEGLSLQASM